MNYEELIKIVVLAFVVSPISLTVTKTEVFKPFRGWMKTHSKFFGKLFSCPYCFSHWTSFAVVGVFRPVPISCGFFFLIDLAVSAFIMVGLATLLSACIFKAVIAMD